jgi:hypothetical protein
MTAPRDSILRRSLRRFTLGSGPLKRRSDRIQVLGRLAVVLSFLLAPPVAVAVATATTAHYQQIAATQAEERSRVQAILVEDAPEPRDLPHGDYGQTAGSTTLVPTRATWSVPGGPSRDGLVRVPPRTPAGTDVPVWIDRDGRLTRAPLDPRDIPGSAAAVATVPLIGLPMATFTLYAALCAALDAHRQRRWADDWAAVEPKWNSRLL